MRNTKSWGMMTWIGVTLGVILYSCASVGRIEGGAIDEEPPLFLKSTPMPGELRVNKQKVTIEFDEYIKLDKPNEKVVISPPQVQQPEIKANGKKTIITLQDTLKLNTTYTFDFGDAIQDNNEGNPLENFTFSFSTGDKLDTMAVAGTVLNAANLEPVKGIQVGLYANLVDSAFTTLPFERVGRTDSRGHFSIRGVAPGKYRIYALQDADQNYYYSQPTEVIAFEDSLVIPSLEQRTRQDTAWIDSLTIDTIVRVDYTYYLPDDILLRCFKESHFNQRLAKYERLTPEKFSFYFTAPADSFPKMRGLNFDEKEAFVVEDITGRKDTLTYWIKDSLLYQKDTLQMELTYLRTDSLNRLMPFTDTLNVVSKLTYAKQLKQRQEAKEKEREAREKKRKKQRKVLRDGEEITDSLGVSKDEVESEPTVFLGVDVYAPTTIDVYDYLTLSFKEPLISVDTTAFHLRQRVDTLWQDVSFEIEQDPSDLKRYNVFADWNFGEVYQFEVDSAAIVGLYGLHTDKIKQELRVKKVEDYGQIFFNVTGARMPAFVELLDGQDKVVRTVPVVDGKADFYFLTPGKYGARLVEDKNGNEQWDTGLYVEKRQPEMVYYYPQMLELKANFELTQDWNVLELPLDKQKVDELKRQKPDDDKKNKHRNNNGNGLRR